MSLAKAPATVLSATVAVQVLILAAGVGSSLLLARLLGPAGRGELAVAQLWPGILVLAGDLGLGFSFSFHSGKDNSRINSLWTLALIFGIGLGTLLAITGWFAFPLFIPAMTGFTKTAFGLCLWSVPMVLTGGYQAYILLGMGFVSDYNAVRVIAALTYVVSVQVCGLAGWTTVPAFSVAFVTAQGMGLILATVLMFRRFRPRLSFSRAAIRPVLGYGIKSHFASMAAQANLKADQALMSVMIAPAQLGLYVVATAVSGVLNPLLSAVTVVVLPAATNAPTPRAAGHIIARYLKAALAFSAPALLIAVLAAPWAIPNFFGAQFAPAVLPAQVLLTAGIFQGLNAVLGNGLRGMGRPGIPALAEGAGLLVTVALLFVLLPRMGILGAAVASLAAYSGVAALQFGFLAAASNVTLAELLSTPVSYQQSLLSIPWLRRLTSGIATGSTKGRCEPSSSGRAATAETPEAILSPNHHNERKTHGKKS